MEIEYRENNIFYNVIRNETSLTEVFCNLMRYKAFRDLFLNFVNNKTKNLNLDFDDIKYEYFDTEKDFNIQEDDIDKKVGRGDLILSMDDLDYIFEIKIENTTKTTKNQPDGYLKYLKEQNKDNYKKRLFFIIPTTYKYKDKLLQSEQINILYWEDFFYELKKSELKKFNIIVNDFYNLVYDGWFYFSKLNFNNLELDYIYNMEKLQMKNSAIPTIMMKLLSIVDELQGTYNAKKYDESLNEFEYVFWIRDKNLKKIFWFGIDYEVWEKYKNPLIIGFEDDKEDIYCKKFKQVFSDKLVKLDDDGIYLPLEIDILRSEDTSAIKNVIDNVIEKIGMEKRT